MEKSEAVQKYRELYRYMIDKNTNALSDLLDESFVLVHMTGMRQSKALFLEAIENGTLNYYSEELESAELSEKVDDISFIGQSRVNAAVFGGGRHTWRLQLKINFQNRDGQWLMTKTVASTY